VNEICLLNQARFASELRNHPHRHKVNYVLQGISHGFSLGFDMPIRLKSVGRNKPSAYEHVDIIDAYLFNEVQQGRVAGPFALPPLQPFQVSSFGVIPKKGQPGKWRFIVDLSSPEGQSVNDGIDPESWTLQYIKIDDVVAMVAKHGPGVLMAKFDVECAYRNIPVHPAERYIYWV
jgi:hypothetical protein